ncbi:MAG: ABC transporter permease [Bacilli bacterium]
MKKYLKIYRIYLITFIKKNLEYRLDFIIGILAMLLEQTISLVFLFVVVFNFKTLANYNLEMLILIFAFASIGRSLNIIFFDGIWLLGNQFIAPGHFDQVLLKPINPLFYIIAQRLRFEAIFQLLTGLIGLIYSFNQLSIPFSLLNIIMVIVFCISSSIIYTSICLFFMSFSFWMNNSLPLAMAMFTFDRATRYPVTIFPNVLKNFLSYLLPYAFVAFYPASYFFKGSFY